MKKLLCLAVVPLLTQCAPTASSNKLNDDVGQTLEGNLFSPGAALNSSPAGVSTPLLLAKGMGQPKYRVMADGSYIARYESGGDYLEIVGTRRSTRDVPRRTDGTVPFASTTANYYFSGNEEPELRAGPVDLTAPGGSTASYLVVFGGTKGGIEKRFPKLEWAK